MLNGMVEQLKKRLFRFRLSTALILTAILAWMMACWPWLTVTRHAIFLAGSETEESSLTKLLLWRDMQGGGLITKETWLELNTRVVYPWLPLTAFFVWKAAREVVESRRRKAAAPE